MARSCISVVLPVYNEHENIAACLRGLWQSLAKHEHEILVCYDFDEDDTLPAIAAMSDKPPSVRLVKNTLGRGAAFAIRAGFAAAEGDVVVTTMADLCDPPDVIPLMAEKIREGADVVAGSRYMKGGSQSGGPLLKRTISRWVGWSMWWIANLGTHDATTNFRAYSKRFLETVAVESKTSFDIALELTVKAHLAGAVVAEVPSSWIDRTAGESRFQMWKWMPNYLRWYVRAMLPPLVVLAFFLALSLAGWLHVAGMQEATLRAGQALFVLDAACLLALWLARRVRGRTRTLDAVHVVLWLVPWQIHPIGWKSELAIAISSMAWIGITCGWKRTALFLFAGGATDETEGGSGGGTGAGGDGGRTRDLRRGEGGAVSKLRASPSGRARGTQATVGRVLLCLLVWIASIIMPRMIASSNGDSCWAQSLGYALTHHLRFGSDLAFTYGPLGYFTTGMYEHDLFLWKVVACEFAYKLLAAVFLTLAALRMSGPLDRAMYFVALVLLPYNFDSYAFVVIAGVTAHLIANPSGNPAFALGGVFILAAMALTKFNLVVVAGACMVAVAVVRWAEVGLPAALRALGAFTLFYLTLWVASGQTLLDLPAYFQRSAQIAQGYNEGESENGYMRELYFGIAIALMMLLLVALYVRERPRSRTRLALGAVFVMLVFVSFKTGFVRIADHPVIFYVFAGMGVFLIPAPSESAAWIRRSATVVRHACFATVVLYLPTALQLDLRGWPGLLFPQMDRYASNIDGLLDLSQLRKDIERDEKSARLECSLPLVRAEVGREPIDMISSEQGLVFLNGLDWKPRPVFMSYATMAPELIEWNAEYFEGDRAPRYILSRLNGIDNRMTTMDDGLALQVIGRDYKPVLAENGLVLLKRAPDGRRSLVPRSILQRKIGFKERVDMSGLPGRTHLLKLHIDYTLWGKFWMTAFKAPEVWMRISLDAGNEAVVRVIPGMMKTGVLFDPYIGTQHDWIEWLIGSELPRVKAFSIDVPECPEMYSNTIGVEILDGDAIAPVADPKIRSRLGTATFDPMPTAIETSIPTSHREFNGQDVLVVQAPAALRFEIATPGSYVLSAMYGLVPEAYTTYTSDGISVSALLQQGQAKRILFRRFVDPIHRVSDRGVQTLGVVFTTTEPSTLTLYTNPGIHNDPTFDWAFWGAVRIRDQNER